MYLPVTDAMCILLQVVVTENELPKHVLYYGWFFSTDVSLIIKDIAESYFRECRKIPQFERFINDACIASGGKGSVN